MSNQQDLGFRKAPASNGPVECLGLTFENEAARREYFIELLREKLKDQAFRQTEGFPIADSDEDILRLSDPPYFTVCPNPFLGDLVAHLGKGYKDSDAYHRDPFAIDVSVGKTDALYKAHSYHTKVPHLAIVPSILHYTKPGEIVLDGFAGSGMTGVAALWCGAASETYRKELETKWKREGLQAPEWGTRQAVLNDLSPAATIIAAGYTLPFDIDAFKGAGQALLDKAEHELGWMYDTPHEDGQTGRVNYLVWSEVFVCPNCAREIVFVNEALDSDTKTVREEFPCPRCRTSLNKDRLERTFEARVDPASRQTVKQVRFRPVLVNYSIGRQDYERPFGEADQQILDRVERLPFPAEVPTSRFPIEQMEHGSRIAPKGFTHAHHFFLPRAARALAALWRLALAEPDHDTRRMLVWFVEQAIWGMSILARYAPTHYSQVNQYLNGVYYVGSQIVEVSPWYILDGKLSRLTRAFVGAKPPGGFSAITTGSCAALPLGTQTVDYVFTDPPFGENIFYADLNFLVEAWHRVRTDAAPEAIIDHPKRKGLHEYQELMRRCFEEYFRVLKPGRWMTVVFSNSSTSVWRAIQEAMGVAGFVVADVGTLDKQQGSYRQVTSSAVKQDLVISAYKPSEALEKKFMLGSATEETAWAFVREHLSNVPKFVGRASEGETISERTPQVLHDRMIAYHVRHGVSVPISGPRFFAGLEQRFAKRDEMYFLPEQVTEYDRRRASVTEVKQLSLFVVDEASAIQWLRRELTAKPRTAQELTPVFMKELQSWAKHEQTIELRELLQSNFLEYNGVPPVPSQIHGYLSTNFKELRNLSKEEPDLIAKANGRWYVPDPSKALDLEKLRERALLREFGDYKASRENKIKTFRTEAVRVGFKAAYDAKDYATIVSVAHKLPETVLQEDEKLLMYYDVASMRVGE